MSDLSQSSLSAEAELAQLQTKLLAWYQQIQRHDRNDGNGPAHRHDIPGVWDSGNGPLSGKVCAQCALWAEAKALAQRKGAAKKA